jgi:hypothetical protein
MRVASSAELLTYTRLNIPEDEPLLGNYFSESVSAVPAAFSLHRGDGDSKFLRHVFCLCRKVHGVTSRKTTIFIAIIAGIV